MGHQHRNVGRGVSSLGCRALTAAPTSTATKLIARLAELPTGMLRGIPNDSLLQTSKVVAGSDHRRSHQESASVGDEASGHTQLFARGEARKWPAGSDG